MKLYGFMKHGKGTVHQAGELSPLLGRIDVVRELDNGVTVIEIRLGSPKLNARWLEPEQQPDDHRQIAASRCSSQ